MLGDPNDPPRVEGEPPAAETVLRRYIAGEIELYEAESTIDDLMAHPERYVREPMVGNAILAEIPGPLAAAIQRDLEEHYPDSL